MSSYGICLSVRLSVTFVYSVKMSNHILKLLSPLYPTFLYQTLWQYSDRNPLTGGVDCRWGMKKSLFSTNISHHHVVNGTTIRCYKHSATRSWQGQVGDTHQWKLCTALEWSTSCHTTVTICCHAILCDRWRRSYNRIVLLIGTYTCRAQGCYCGWSRVILSGLMKYSMTGSIVWPLCDCWAACQHSVVISVVRYHLILTYSLFGVIKKIVCVGRKNSKTGWDVPSPGDWGGEGFAILCLVSHGIWQRAD